jgi:transmembrane protein TMEM260 (protein O-mannosyltransferase)
MTPPTRARLARLSERGPAVGAPSVGAIGVFACAIVLYLQTMLPGISVGDWAEAQFVPAQLGVPHPTGYPLFVLLGKAFSLIPVGSIAFRADLLSATAAAASAGAAVLIASRLGVRLILAIAAGLTLAVTGELWLEATYPEMNSLHLLLVAAVIHRAIVWRQERRDRDLLIGAGLAGLSLSNHLLAITAVPIVILFVLVDARSRLRERPVILVQAAALFLAGLLPYLLIPLRALAGPAVQYSGLLTWDGFSSLVTGAQFRGDMHFTTGESLAKAWRNVPDVVAQFQTKAHPIFVYGGLAGFAVQLIRARWVALMLLAVVAANLYFFANYLGDLDHYLLVTWLAMTIWLATAAEAGLGWLEAHWPRLAESPALAVFAFGLPLLIGVTNWTTYDESQNHIGDDLAATIYADLPPNAVLLTYWDVLTTLGYSQCVDGVRPDVALRSYDVSSRIVCNPVAQSFEELAKVRPVYALFAIDSELDGVRRTFRLEPGPRLALPYGQRYLDHEGVLYRLIPKATAGSG